VDRSKSIHHEGTKDHEDHEESFCTKAFRVLRAASCLRDKPLMPARDKRETSREGGEHDEEDAVF
jgi:hypothetical protein